MGAYIRTCTHTFLSVRFSASMCAYLYFTCAHLCRSAHTCVADFIYACIRAFMRGCRHICVIADIYVQMLARMCTCLHKCVYERIYAYMRAYMHNCGAINVDAYISAPLRTLIRTCVHRCVYACIYANMRASRR